MQKLNTLGVELQSLKEELLKPGYSVVVQKALKLQADELAKNNIIDVDLHLALTNEKIETKEFSGLLYDNPVCLKTKEEMLVEFEQIRETLQAQLDADEISTGITSKSIVDTDQIAFTRTFQLDKQWVSEYFGQPADEVGKLMVRNGFVEKFAVLRLAKILDSFLKSEQFVKDEMVECKATRVFYDLENSYYGIHLMFYLNIEDAEVEDKATAALDYIRQMNKKVTAYMDERMKI